MHWTEGWFLWLVAAYLVGSLPVGLLIGYANGIDIRDHGSGNVGATNVGRVLGKRLGIFCFVIDVAKGFAPVFTFGLRASLVAGGGAAGAEAAGGPVLALNWVAVAAATMLGNVFPVWLRFRGGKGVATGLGALLGIWPVLTLAGLAAGLLWAGVVLVWRYVSLASIAAAAALPLLSVAAAWATSRPAGEVGVYALATAALALMVVVRHRSNIARLRAGTEPRVLTGNRTADA